MSPPMPCQRDVWMRIVLTACSEVVDDDGDTDWIDVKEANLVIDIDTDTED